MVLHIKNAYKKIVKQRLDLEKQRQELEKQYEQIKKLNGD